MTQDTRPGTGKVEPGSSPSIDSASSMKAGTDFDPLQLAKYLEGKLEGVHGTLVVEQFSKGYSNLTYLLRAGDREYVLRRPPPGVHIKSAHDMGREHRILSRLSAVWPKVPKPLLFCEDTSVLGTPFYVMERVRGVILRARVRSGMELGPDRMRRISEAAVDTLAEIHGIDYQAAGLGDLGKPDGYVERQIRGWSDRFSKAQTDPVPAMDDILKWLDSHKPKESGAALIHNDYKYDNLVLDLSSLNRVIAVLDWEMATIGDPLMDLGTTLGYWVQADDPPVFQAMQFGPTYLPGNLTRAQIIERYEKKTGRQVNNVVFYYVFALYKLAVVAQQLYRRYKEGLSSDARFAAMLDGVRHVALSGVEAINKGRIDRLGE